MTTRERVRLAGIACAGGGALWVLVLLAVAAAPETVRGSLTSYRLWEAAPILAQALLLVGVAGLAWSARRGLAGPGRPGYRPAGAHVVRAGGAQLLRPGRRPPRRLAAPHSWGLGLAALLARLAGSTAVAVAGPRAMAERGPAAGAALAPEARGAAAGLVNAGAGAGAGAAAPRLGHRR